MSQKKRHQQIITKLNIEGQVFVKELAVMFDVTEDCIRKDLTILEKAGKLKRVHGGAVNIRVNLHHTNVSERVELYSKEKKIIASKALDINHICHNSDRKILFEYEFCEF